MHLAETAITGTNTAEQVPTWCGDPDTDLVVKPVIDLSEHLHTESYEVSAPLRDQVILRDHTGTLDVSRDSPP